MFRLGVAVEDSNKVSVVDIGCPQLFILGAGQLGVGVKRIRNAVDGVEERIEGHTG